MLVLVPEGAMILGSLLLAGIRAVKVFLCVPLYSRQISLSPQQVARKPFIEEAARAKTWYVVDIRFAPGRKPCISLSEAVPSAETGSGMGWQQAWEKTEHWYVLRNSADIERRN
jgi:hypothetical protein